ncbi:hypothetical protein M6B38_147870 [Iris pallida]|uniref:Uncharacterized protein n=1 Tax=Iris pallida TaxID=29817 RepID=A0AAX6F7W8_IRIPA|nr:hypothetical protein M6B38_147870 [Iris pallida]
MIFCPNFCPNFGFALIFATGFDMRDTSWCSRLHTRSTMRHLVRPLLKELVEDITERRQAKLWWSFPDYSTENCTDCELGGKTCGFSWERNVSFFLLKNLSHSKSFSIPFHSMLFCT